MFHEVMSYHCTQVAMTFCNDIRTAWNSRIQSTHRKRCLYLVQIVRTMVYHQHIRFARTAMDLVFRVRLMSLKCKNTSYHTPDQSCSWSPKPATAWV